MSFGKNLQYLIRLCDGMTEEALAQKLNVSCRTIAQWEKDEAEPETEQALELSRLFHCPLDSLLKDEMDQHSSAYSNLRVEEVPAFCYVQGEVICSDPIWRALEVARKFAKDHGVDDPKLIGWKFPKPSGEEFRLVKGYGYAAAWILPEGMELDGVEIREQAGQRYAAVHIEHPYPAHGLAAIPGGYQLLKDYMRTNGLEHVENEVIPCFETDGESIDVYMACT